MPKLKPTRKRASILPASTFISGSQSNGWSSGRSSPGVNGALVISQRRRHPSASRAIFDQAQSGRCRWRSSGSCADAEPDGNRFDLDADLNAPAGGVFGQIVGTSRPAIRYLCPGRRALDPLAGQVPGPRVGIADCRTGAVQRCWKLRACRSAGAFLDTHGKLQRLTAPVLRVQGDGKLADRSSRAACTLPRGH